MKHAITGAINSGKTYFANELQKRMDYQIIEVDDVRRHLLWDSTEKNHVLLREFLSDEFQISTSGNYKFLNREELTNKIFARPENLKQYSLIATPFIKEHILTIQKNKSFLVWVFILEENYDEMCDGKIIEVIDSNPIASDFLKQRDVIQKNALFKRKREADIEYHRTNVDNFIRNYL